MDVLSCEASFLDSSQCCVRTAVFLYWSTLEHRLWSRQQAPVVTHLAHYCLPSWAAPGTCHLTMKCDLLLCVKCEVKRENNQASEDINLVVKGFVPGTHLTT